MSHDSRYETECPEHGWYFYEDGCAVAGCENAPPTEAPWAQYKGLTNEAAVDAWAEARRAEEAREKVRAALPAEHAPPDPKWPLVCNKCGRKHGDPEYFGFVCGTARHGLPSCTGRFDWARGSRPALAGRGPDYEALAIEFNRQPLTFSDGIQLSPAAAVRKFAAWLGGRNDA